MTRPLFHSLTLALLLGLVAAPAAFAQETPAPQQQPQMEAATEVADDERDAFAEAYLGVETLQAGLQDQLSGVNDPTEAQQIQQQFNDQAVEVVQGSGLTPERYDEILMAAQVDTELAEDLVARMDELRSN